MYFICKSCSDAADMPITEDNLSLVFLKKKGHEKCKGETWCDCQHRVKK